MKWPTWPTASELLSKKTFLANREDLKVIKEENTGSEDRELEEKQGSNTSGGGAGTWPLSRMRKRPPRGEEQQGRDELLSVAGGTSSEETIDEDATGRPATASLEAPLVLDPRFVDKLDMSLISKESLTASLTHICLGLDKVAPLVKSPTPRAIEAPASNNNYQPSTTPATNNRAKPRGALIPPIKAPLKANPSSPNKSREILDFRSALSSALGGDLGPSESKRLDTNNNKNKFPRSPPRTTSHSQLTPLNSPVGPLQPFPISDGRRRHHHHHHHQHHQHHQHHRQHQQVLVGPEACTSCGRSSQPERLHSHPRSPVQSPQPPSLTSSIQEQVQALGQPSKSTPSVIPVRSSRNLHQPLSARPALANVNVVAPAPSNHQISVVSSGASSAMDDKVVNDETTKKRRPRSVTCYVCGRDFGSASFPIHEPKCLERWHRENKELPVAQRRNVPERPNLPIDHEDWNAAAWSQSQALLIPCQNCKRTFQPDRLAVHERTCRAQPKSNRSGKSSCPSVSIKSPAAHHHHHQQAQQQATILQRSARSVQELLSAHRDNRPASPRGCCIPILMRSRPASPRQAPHSQPIATVESTLTNRPSSDVPLSSKRSPAVNNAAAGLQVKKSSSRIAVRQKSSNERKRVV